MRSVLFFVTFVVLLLNSACKKDTSNGTSEILTQLNTLEEFEQFKSSGVVLVFFHAQWCSRCKAQRPMVEAASQDPRVTQVKFAEVDYEANRQVVERYQIAGFPEIVLFKNGVEAGRIGGSNNSAESIIARLIPLID